MDCTEIQAEIALFSDDQLSESGRAFVEGHLRACPLCRQELDDIRALRAELSSLARPAIPAALTESIREAVGAALTDTPGLPAFAQLDRRRSWFDVWLMPSAAAAFATLVLGFGLLTLMLSGNSPRETSSAAADVPTRTAVYLDPLDSGDVLTAAGYARSRMAFAAESPSINPQGALVALTRSLVRGEMKDDEVTVVADVFGDGLAKISEVVEPSHNEKAVADLRKALESDPAFAPFVPASMDGRADPVRVVLKIQSVNIDTGLKDPGRNR